MSILSNEIELPEEHIANVFGEFDCNTKKIERTFHVSIIVREGAVKVIGEPVQAKRAMDVLEELLELSRRGNTITEQNVDYAMALAMENQSGSLVAMDEDLICHTLMGRPIKPKTLGQKSYEIGRASCRERV